MRAADKNRMFDVWSMKSKKTFKCEDAECIH